ncbi:MAG TPA: ABC transporter permease [Gaiellaceae bacterium]|nr:ABC transporter permease [Gaiellaceae bacterium]
MTAIAERLEVQRLLTPRWIGILGIAIGVVAFWISLPPVAQRTLFWPIVVGAAAAALGGWAIVHGERRVGWGAVASGALGGGLGVLATYSSVTHLDTVFVWGALLAAMLRYATPLTFAAIGGMFSERSGVVNIGLEGMMLMGAFFGIWGADVAGSWIVGILIAMAFGGLLALVHAFFAIHLRADQIVGGVAINFLALGITGYMFIDVYGSQGTPANVPAIPDVHIGGLDKIPPGAFWDDLFGQLNLMIWISFLVLVLSYVVMFRTPLGLRIRSVGEHPKAADTVGISVYGIRYGAVVLSGILSAMGGAYLSIGFVHSFNQNMTAGRGFIALAALIFGKWRPGGAFAAALLFGFSSALAQRLPTYSGSAATLFQTLPYVLTLIAVAGVIGRSIPPAADGRPYVKQ